MDRRISMRLGDWALQQEGARAVRIAVFVIEQKVPETLEWDEMDAVSTHALVRDADSHPIATGRLLPDGHIGRMAVSAKWRGQGLGSMVLQALMAEARKRGDRAVVLSAQLHAERFYARFGFVREGEEFMDAGIPHVQMRHHF